MYDYVIAGGGSAGCVLAARLSEMSDAKVLLIEAGPRDRDPYIHMPVGFFKMTSGPLIWGYRDGAGAACQWTHAWSIRRRACWAAAARSMPKSIRAAARRIMTAGRRRAAPAGPMTRSSPISSSRRTIIACRAHARRRRAVRRFRSHQPKPLVARLRARLHGYRHALQSRFQFGKAGRLRALSDDDPQWPALQHGGRLSASRVEPRQSDASRPIAWCTRDRRSRTAAPSASRSSRAGRKRICGARSDRHGRRDRLAQTADAVGHRPGRHILREKGVSRCRMICRASGRTCTIISRSTSSGSSTAPIPTTSTRSCTGRSRRGFNICCSIRGR